MKAIQKKGVALVLLCLFTMLTPIVVHAQIPSEIAQPLTVYISGCDATLAISDKGVATVSAYVRGKAGSSTYVHVTLQVKSGTQWSDVKTWEKTSSGAYVSVNETYSVSKGTYRVVAKVKANTESKTITSASKTY